MAKTGTGASAVTLAFHSLTDSAKLLLDQISQESENVVTFTCSSYVAAGTTQGTATLIAADTATITSTGLNQGVILPAGCYRVILRNVNATNAIFVYPPSGAKFGTSPANTPISLIAGGVVMYAEISGTQWDFVTMS
jgi:hypothetical protein